MLPRILIVFIEAMVVFNHISHPEGPLSATAVWNQNPGCDTSVEEGRISKLVSRNPPPINAEDNHTGTYVWSV